MKRKARVGEVVCRCGAYKFPHRQMGGECNGGIVVSEHWEQQQCGDCRECFHFEQSEEDGFRCKVLHGGEAIQQCPVLQEHVRFHSIKLYGVNAPPKKGPLYFRR